MGPSQILTLNPSSNPTFYPSSFPTMHPSLAINDGQVSDRLETTDFNVQNNDPSEKENNKNNSSMENPMIFIIGIVIFTIIFLICIAFFYTFYRSKRQKTNEKDTDMMEYGAQHIELQKNVNDDFFLTPCDPHLDNIDTKQSVTPQHDEDVDGIDNFMNPENDPIVDDVTEGNTEGDDSDSFIVCDDDEVTVDNDVV